MSVPEALDLRDTPGVWALPGKPIIVAEHPEYQLTGSQYHTQRKINDPIIPAPMWAFTTERFTAQTDQNIWSKLPRSRLAAVKNHYKFSMHQYIRLSCQP